VFLWFLVRFGYDQTAAKVMQTVRAENGILPGEAFLTGGGQPGMLEQGVCDMFFDQA
jgi:hypothetical protein